MHSVALKKVILMMCLDLSFQLYNKSKHISFVVNSYMYVFVQMPCTCVYTRWSHVFSQQAKTEEEVLSEREGLEKDKVWVVHSRGFTLGTVHQSPTHHSNLTRLQVL